MAQTENERQAALLIEMALREVDEIANARPQQYADELRLLSERRPFTMKDAKPRARNAARFLRDAWEMLDPSLPQS